MNLQPFLFGADWIEVRDGNDTARNLFDRHYSRYVHADGRKPKIFVGPGEKMVLLRPDASALFAWRKFISDAGQQGVNCAIFRNETSELASELIRTAMCLAWARWPGVRFYTYVDPREVQPTFVRGVPVFGFCFLKAGWSFAGVTKGRKFIWEYIP